MILAADLIQPYCEQAATVIEHWYMTYCYTCIFPIPIIYNRAQHDLLNTSPLGGPGRLPGYMYSGS